MKDEWWLRAAISDDNLVADLLLRLKDSIPSSSSPSSSSSATFLLPPSWGTRQPRSKPPATSSSLSLSAPPEKKLAATRRSPTTPLSWTCGGASASPSDGGCEESSSLNQLHTHTHPQPSDRVRSKASAASDTPASSSKRPRRKKTFAELREEESTLMKERSSLKKELATMRQTLIEQRSINEKLKRIKLDLGVGYGIKPEASSVHLDQGNAMIKGIIEAASSSASRQVKTEAASELSCAAQKGFVLPDLNMAPDEECGIAVMS